MREQASFRESPWMVDARINKQAPGQKCDDVNIGLPSFYFFKGQAYFAYNVFMPTKSIYGKRIF